MHVSELMIHPVHTCPADAHLDVAARIMWDHDCGALPVVDNEGHAVGMLTDRDICMAAYTQGKRLNQIGVRSAMAASVLACHVNDSVEAVERVMQEGRVRRVPILDDDRRVVGIVALNDLARHAARARKGGVDREIVTTLAAICEPRSHMDLALMNHSAGGPILVTDAKAPRRRLAAH
jgi:CBS domain-containing protein